LNKLILLTALAATAAAHQPTPVNVTLSSRLATNGDNYLQFTNNTAQAHTLALAPGANATVRFLEQRVILAPNGTTTVSLGPLRFTEGNHLLHVTTQLVETDRRPAAGPGPSLLEVYEMRGGSLILSSIEKTYLNKRIALEGPSEDPAEPIAPLAFAARPMSDSVRITPVNMPDPDQLAALPLGLLPASSTVTNPSSAFADYAVNPNGPNEPIPGSNITLKGRFVGKVDIGWGIFSNEPAWGWTVTVYQKQNSWKFRGRASVSADGSFTVKLDPKTDPDLPVTIHYQAANAFVRIVDSAQQPYTWRVTRTITSGINAIGTYSADLTANGDLPFLPVIMDSASKLWQKFAANGMNPRRDTAIRILFPNTLDTGECQSKDGKGNLYPWSCAAVSDGKIAIIAAHAIEFVIQHELAHSINSFFWKGYVLKDAGGDHAPDQCYTNGLGLSEGFANFVPHWVRFDRTATAPKMSYFDTNLENVPTDVCNGGANETRVAALFWDMYDTVQDGPDQLRYDNLYFNQPSGVISVFLANPTSSALSFFQIYLAITGPAWEESLKQVFRLNTIM
jgi:hypothetical protein